MDLLRPGFRPSNNVYSGNYGHRLSSSAAAKIIRGISPVLTPDGVPTNVILVFLQEAISICALHMLGIS